MNSQEKHVQSNAVRRAAQWKKDNPEKAKLHAKQYRNNHLDAAKAASLKWNLAHPEKTAQAKQKYRTSVGGMAKERSYDKEYRAKSRDKIKVTRDKYYEENKAELNEKSKKWRLANAQKAKDSIKAWRANHPNLTRIHKQNRRARKHALGGVLSKGLADKLFMLQRGKCACGCGKPLGGGYHLDHRMPLALGGANEDWNMQLLKATCNLQKHAKHPVDFMQSRGFLI